MKFIYLLCLSFIIFSYVKADEEYDNEEEEEEEVDSLSPREHVESSYNGDNSVYEKEPEILPPRPPPPKHVEHVKVTKKPLKERMSDIRKQVVNQFHEAKEYREVPREKLAKLKTTTTTTTTTTRPTISSYPKEKFVKPTTLPNYPPLNYPKFEIHKFGVNSSDAQKNIIKKLEEVMKYNEKLHEAIMEKLKTTTTTAPDPVFLNKPVSADREGYYDGKKEDGHHRGLVMLFHLYTPTPVASYYQPASVMKKVIHRYGKMTRKEKRH